MRQTTFAERKALLRRCAIFLRRATSIWKQQGGVSLLEIALLMPVFLSLILGVCDLGRLGYTAIEVANAARAGVAYGAQSHITAADDTGMKSAALNDAPALTNLAASASHSCICSGTGVSSPTCALSACSTSHMLVYVQVTTSMTYVPSFSVLGVPGSIPISWKAEMRAGN